MRYMVRAFSAGLYPVLCGLILTALLMGGCSTPNVQSNSFTRSLHPDEEDNFGGTFM
jgi:hypothetical protein